VVNGRIKYLFELMIYSGHQTFRGTGVARGAVGAPAPLRAVKKIFLA